jgi:hypothetical protein
MAAVTKPTMDCRQSTTEKLGEQLFLPHYACETWNSSSPVLGMPILKKHLKQSFRLDQMPVLEADKRQQILINTYLVQNGKHPSDFDRVVGIWTQRNDRIF